LSRGLKQVILGLAVVGFGMALAIASLVWLMGRVVSALTNSPGFDPMPLFVALLAIIVALGGLAVAYSGTTRDD
jgi:multisubunit Na+/H+ antiporter MnhC subunit